MDNSFIYEFIIKSAQIAPDSSYTKTKKINVEAFDIGVAKKLVNKLSRQLSGQSEPVNITSNKEAPLDLSRMRSLGDFLKYLSENEIKVDGSQIAYDYNFAKVHLNDQKLSEMLPVTIDKMHPENNFYVNKSALQKYLQHLKDEANLRKDNRLSQLVTNLETHIPGLLAPPVPTKDVAEDTLTKKQKEDKEDKEDIVKKTPSGVEFIAFRRSVDSTISQIMSELPLTFNDIDFDRIESFFTQIESLLGKEEKVDSNVRTKSASFRNQIRDVREAIRQVQSLCRDSAFKGLPLHSSLDAISSYLKTDSSMPSFLNVLHIIIAYVQNIIRLFRSAYQRQLQDLDSSYITKLDNQDNIASQNMTQLRSWIGQDRALRARVGA